MEDLQPRLSGRPPRPKYRISAPQSSSFFFIGHDGARLHKYDGPIEDARLATLSCYAMCAEAAPADTPHVPTGSVALPSLPLQSLCEQGVRWKAQFGSSIVGYGESSPLQRSEAEADANRRFTAEELKSRFDKPKCSSFVSRTFANIDDVTGFLMAITDADCVEVKHILRASNKSATGKHTIVYEREGATRDAVLDPQPFQALGQYDERRMMNDVFMPPAAAGRSLHDYVLLRCQATEATQQAEPQPTTLYVQLSDGKPVVTFAETMMSAGYARVEERHVVRLRGTDAEIHVTEPEEFGSTVAEKSKRVRVELRLRDPASARSTKTPAELWEGFLQLASELCAHLGVLAAKESLTHSQQRPTQVYCNGETQLAFCERAFCRLRHRYTVCLYDACDACTLPSCNFWHGVSEVRQLLRAKEVTAPLQPYTANLRLLGVRRRGWLRTTLSRHLQRFLTSGDALAGRSPEDKAVGTGDAALKQRLIRLVAEHNATVHMLDAAVVRSARPDFGLVARLCRRLNSPLLVLSSRDAFVQACETAPSCILFTSSTGSGKSTQLPQYLAECAAIEAASAQSDGGVRRKMVLCVEPTSLAAASLTERVASQYSADAAAEEVERVCCYLDDGVLPMEDADIVFTTEQALLSLLRKREVNLQTDVYAVMVDEAHERTLAGDVLLGLLKREMQSGCPFRLVVCSATLHLQLLQTFFPAARHITAAGEPFPVEITFREARDDVTATCDYVGETLEAVLSVLTDPPTLPGAKGAPQSAMRHVLAFLPTAADVEEARRRLEADRRAHPRGSADRAALRVYAVSADQTLEEQRRVFEDVEEKVQKIIFATAVGETSITIDGVGYVIDCGLASTTAYSAEHHVGEEVIVPVTQSAATQRAGRAGRGGPGVCVRLYSRRAYDLFMRSQPAGVSTSSLHAAVLQLAASGVPFSAFEWPEAPAERAVTAALEELEVHGAFSESDPADAPVHTMSRFGECLAALHRVTVPEGKLLYLAGQSGDAELLALAALAMACVQQYPRMFTWSATSQTSFHMALRAWAKEHDASAYGDIVCLTCVMVDAMHSFPEDGSRTTAPPQNFAFVRADAVHQLRARQRELYRAAVLARVLRGCDVVKVQPPAVSLNAARSRAAKLHRLVVKSFFLQVATRSTERPSHYQLLSDPNCEYDIAAERFVGHPALTPSNTTVAYLDPSCLPDVCVFAHLHTYRSDGRTTLSLCTPALAEWLPAAEQEKLRKVRPRQPLLLCVYLPSVLASVWQGYEVSAWLSGKLDGACCRVVVDRAANLLALFGDEGSAEEAKRLLAAAVGHAMKGERCAPHEIPLSGFCRITCTNGGVAGSFLRDQSDFVTLLFTGAVNPAMRCLALDLAERVAEWSERWFGHRQRVAVRPGVGGAASADGRWAAHVTFADADAARRFHDRFQRTAEAERHLMTVQPYCEQTVLAPALGCAAPGCRIGVRLCLGRGDPETWDAGGQLAPFPLDRVLECRTHLLAALPGEVVVESQEIDPSHGVLYAQLVTPSESVGTAVLDALRRIRGTLLHCRALFLSVAHVADFPLPQFCDRALQLMLRDAACAMAARLPVEGHRVQCETVFAAGYRSLWLQCPTSAALADCLGALQESIDVHRCELGDEGLAPAERARRLYALWQRRETVSEAFNATNAQKSRIAACQLQWRAADAALCFVGKRVSAWAALQKHLRSALTSAATPTHTHDQRVAAEVPMRDLELEQLTGSRAALRRVRVDETGSWVEEEECEGCAVCLCPLQPRAFRLMCGHQFCTECLAGVFTVGGAAPTLPVRCPTCGSQVAAAELAQFAPPAALQGLGAYLRGAKLDSDATAEPCLNRLCLGVPRTPEPDKRLCSGCLAAYCRVCSGRNGMVRSWHDGQPHRTDADSHAADLVEQLPLQLRCPRCPEIFYDFDDCFAVKCSQGHAFCGFCMVACGADAHPHVRRCQRNPRPGDLFGGIRLFYQLRAEDLAASVKQAVRSHPSRSLALAEAVCAAVELRMSDDWPREPLWDARDELRQDEGLLQRTTAPMSAATPATNPLEAQLTRGAGERDARSSSVEAARRAVRNLSVPAWVAEAMQESDVLDAEELRRAALCVDCEAAVHFSSSIDAALGAAGGSATTAAALLFAFLDVKRSVESVLRGVGPRDAAPPQLAAFVRLLLRGLQDLRTTAPTDAVRAVTLTASQCGGYIPGSVVVWGAPTVCEPESGCGTATTRSRGAAAMHIRCSAYAYCAPWGTFKTARLVLPAGARLRVREVAGDEDTGWSIVLEQEGDFGLQV